MPGQIHAIKTIKIICKPCSFCKELDSRLKNAISKIEQEYKVKISYKHIHSKIITGIEKLSVSAASMPIVLINGKTELAAGRSIPSEKILKNKLLEIIKYGHVY
jgi:hypothetical protein